MKIPSGMTEDEVINIINKVCKRLSQKFTFGYHTKEDIYQQAFIFGLEGLENYEEGRPLENFLWVHIKNRLCTFKRDNYGRPDKPCLDCKLNAYDSFSEICNKFDDLSECKLYNGWYKRNSSKRNLLRPIDLDNVQGDREKHLRSLYGIDDIICNEEILDIIDSELSPTLRSNYLKMLSGISISKNKRQKIQEIILEILYKSGYDQDEKTCW